jgi:hypothetical protein
MLPYLEHLFYSSSATTLRVQEEELSVTDVYIALVNA